MAVSSFLLVPLGVERNPLFYWGKKNSGAISVLPLSGEVAAALPQTEG